MQRVYGLVCALALFLAVPATHAGAQTAPPSMTGERLGGIVPGTVTITSRSCNIAGQSTFTYEASGVAIGPYPGTFTEQGTVVLGPQTFGDPTSGPPLTGNVLALNATFEIISGAYVIHGEKHLGPVREDFIGAFDNSGGCADLPSPTFPVGVNGTVTFARSRFLEWTATIQGPEGTFTDHGQVESDPTVVAAGCLQFGATGCSEVTVVDNHFDCVPGAPACGPTARIDGNFFDEIFTSSQATALPTLDGRPGKGCGDKNHVHERFGECK